MYKIAFFDIDGTLVDHEKNIPESTGIAIEELRSKGFEIVIATGRAPFSIVPFADALGITSYICCNGAIVYHNGTCISATPISNETLEGIQIKADQKDHMLLFIGEEHIEVDEKYKELIPYLDMFQASSHPTKTHENQNPFYQLYLSAPNEIEEYSELLREAEIIDYRNGSYDIHAKGMSKAYGVEKMLTYLGIPKESAIAFGDGYNDIEMLTFVGMGIAMGNAKEEAKRSANMVTQNVDNDGIYHALKTLNII